MKKSRPKILIIRFSSIGDIILTSPVIRILKTQLKADVHFLTKRKFQDVIRYNPFLDKYYTIEKNIREVLAELKAEKYDFVLDLHRNLRSLQVKRALKSPNFTFDKINRQKWLMVNFKINQLPNTHIVDRYLTTAIPLGVTNDGKGLDYFIGDSNEVPLPSPLIPFAPNRYIAFVIGAAHSTKRLPKHKLINICKAIDHPIVLLGGPNEKEDGNDIVQKTGNHVINTCGALKLNQSASVVQQSAKVITHDTGLMHMAAAFKKPILSIWGNTIPEFGMYPYYPEGIDKNISIEVKELKCRPCSKIGYPQCPKKHFKCMESIDESYLVKQLGNLDA